MMTTRQQLLNVAQSLLIRGCRLMLAAVAVASFVPATARAADTIIGFDNLPNGTQVISQYHALGVDLDRAANLAPLDPTTTPATISATPDAYSAPNALVLEENGGGEFRSWFLGATFANAHHQRVKMWVRSLVGGNVTLSAYRRPFPGENPNAIPTINGVPDPKLLGQVTVNVPARSKVATPIAIDAGQQQVQNFTVTSEFSSGAAIDDLTFDTVTGPEGPDFGLRILGTGMIHLTPGGPAAGVTVQIQRFTGSSGPVTLDVNNLPPGVVLDSITPNPSNGPDGATVTVKLRASAGAPGALNTPIQITANGPASATQYGVHLVKALVEIDDTYDAQVVGMEVTQGIQNYNLPARTSPSSTDPVSYNQAGNAGITLAQGAHTAVRVFADLRKAPSVNLPVLLNCQLTGTRNGVPLPGGPLGADIPNGTGLTLGPDTVSDNMRAGKSNLAYFVELPDSWASGTISLTATLVSAAGGPAGAPMGGLIPGISLPVTLSDSNPSNNSFTLTDIAFQPTLGISVEPVKLTVDPNRYDAVNKSFFYAPQLDLTADPWYVLGPAGKLLPVDEAMGFELHSWAGEIAIDDIWNSVYNDAMGNPLADQPTTRAQKVAQRLADDSPVLEALPVNGVPQPLIIGVFPGDDQTNVVRGNTQYGVAIVQQYDRPYSSVAHEMGHLLTRKHASSACGASNTANGAFESWPPDQRGELQGVGFDTRSGRVLFQPRNPTTGQSPLKDAKGNIVGPEFLDMMSYCGNNSGGDTDKWISVQGWGELLNVLKKSPPGQLAAPGGGGLQPRFLAATPMLIVRGLVYVDGSTHVEIVHPGDDPSIQPDPASPYHVVTRDAAGNVLADAPMQVRLGHVDDVGELPDLSAEVPAMNVQSVEITFNGATVASRKRSPNPPTVQMMNVQPDVIRAGVKVTSVQWQASDADNDPLLAHVDYSADGGNSWRTIYTGPNANQATLTSGYFSALTNGLIRIRVNDGFNETSAMSQLFTAGGQPPFVQITSPVLGRTIKADASFDLCGQAFDDQQNMLSADNLAWFVDGKSVGPGTCVSVKGLAPGRRTIRLQATDLQGRVGSRTLTVMVTP